MIRRNDERWKCSLMTENWRGVNVCFELQVLCVWRAGSCVRRSMLWLYKMMSPGLSSWLFQTEMYVVAHAWLKKYSNLMIKSGFYGVHLQNLSLVTCENNQHCLSLYKWVNKQRKTGRKRKKERKKEKKKEGKKERKKERKRRREISDHMSVYA